MGVEAAAILITLSVAQSRGWPDPAAAVTDIERALGGEPWTETSLPKRIDAAQMACEAGITRACRGEGTGTPLSAEVLDWLETALDGLRERVDPGRPSAPRGRTLSKRPSRLTLGVPPVECQPGTMGGRPVFKGTRVPIEVLFENLADGLTLAEIVDSHPTLNADDCRVALREACRLLGEAARRRRG